MKKGLWSLQQIVVIILVILIIIFTFYVLKHFDILKESFINVINKLI